MQINYNNILQIINKNSVGFNPGTWLNKKKSNNML